MDTATPPTTSLASDPSPPLVPVSTTDPINARILAVSEDRIAGFREDPLGDIAAAAGLEAELVATRLAAMLRAGVIRRIRQTLLATNLAHGCLVAWEVDEDRLATAFDWMFQNDPFSGHVVIRSTDQAIAAARYRLWTTLKVPQGFVLERHCDFLLRQTGCRRYVCMPARRLFVLGVGHVRRRGLEPGAMADEPADAIEPALVHLSDLEWRVLAALKRELAPEELRRDLWALRAAEAGVSLGEFLQIGRSLHERGVIGRFSTFLEHVKPLTTGERVTRFNALFHWAVPPGREIDAGREVGRFHIMTHAYWREAGPEFGNVNIMGVAHGQEKDTLLAHKRAIDAHLAARGIPVTYTNVFWGGRSEIKPSEVTPLAYEAFCAQWGLDPRAMRA
jgi:hypothetical protein